MSSAFDTLPTDAKGIQPFVVAIPEEDLQEFKQLITLSKVAQSTFENTQEDRRYGVTAKWLADAKEHWVNAFNWRTCERNINSFPNFKASIEDNGEGYSVHFAALFSKNPDAVPVVSVHGWPGSFLEFLPILSLAREQYTPDTLPYHLIIPSMPGYTFSSGPPVNQNFDIGDTARILHQVMVNLGFESGYVATGGDVGSGIARFLAAKYDACKAMHLNYCALMKSPESVPMESLDDFEKRCLERGTEFQMTGSAYAMEQGTRPSTIGLVLTANPLALLAWIGEKFLTWSDEDPSLDSILESVSLWWFTETMPRSCYPYRRFFEDKARGHDSPDLHVKKPFGYSLFPKELRPVPKSWAATTGDLSWFRQHESGGHFAAFEKPAEMKQDLEDFLRHVTEEKGIVFGD